MIGDGDGNGDGAGDGTGEAGVEELVIESVVISSPCHHQRRSLGDTSDSVTRSTIDGDLQAGVRSRGGAVPTQTPTPTPGS